MKQNSRALSQVIDFTDLMQGGNSIPKTLLIQTISNSSHCQTPYVCYRKESSISNLVWHSEVHFSLFTHLFYFSMPLKHFNQYCTMCIYIMLLYNLSYLCMFPQIDQKLFQRNNLLNLVSPYSITVRNMEWKILRKKFPKSTS